MGYTSFAFHFYRKKEEKKENCDSTPKVFDKL